MPGACGAAASTPPRLSALDRQRVEPLRQSGKRGDRLLSLRPLARDVRGSSGEPRAFARFNFGELGDNLEALGGGEPGNSGALSVDPEPRAALLASAYPEIGDWTAPRK